MAIKKRVKDKKVKQKREMQKGQNGMTKEEREREGKQ